MSATKKVFNPELLKKVIFLWLVSFSNHVVWGSVTQICGYSHMKTKAK